MALFKKLEKEIPGRLFAVGDLVDRGAENMQCIELLGKPWFTAIRGNHEDLCISGMFNEASKRCHISNGGQWFYMLDDLTMYNIAKLFSELPVALEAEHKGKVFGFVHGNIEHNDWELFKKEINSVNEGRHVAFSAMWGRDRFGDWENLYPPIQNVHAVILGHTVSPKPVKRQNCYFIDTGAVHYGTLTVINVDEV